MIKRGHALYNTTLVFSAISTVFLIYIMLAMPVYKVQLFIERDTFSIPGIVMIIGFGLIFLFTLVSVIWLAKQIQWGRKAAAGDTMTFLLGILCLIALVGEKVMLDEIGREIRLGWETRGEWILLYIGLSIQLIYNFVIIRRLFHVFHARITPLDAL